MDQVGANAKLTEPLSVVSGYRSATVRQWIRSVRGAVGKFSISLSFCTVRLARGAILAVVVP